MRYLGGKSKIATRMAPYLTAHPGDLYIEPFLGSGAVFEKVAPHYEKAIASDANPDLMLMWSAVADGWMPPMMVRKDRYLMLKHDPTPSPERSFVGFACSYGGSWFAGYIDDDWHTTVTRKRYNAAQIARTSVVRTGRLLARFPMETCDYAKHGPLMRDGVVVYCDPPYQATQNYVGTDEGRFDHDRFWATMNEWSDAGATVLVSEYDAPDGWRPGWSERKFAWGGGTRRIPSVEVIWERVP